MDKETQEDSNPKELTELLDQLKIIQDELYNNPNAAIGKAVSNSLSKVQEAVFWLEEAVNMKKASGQ